jgi:hypothetical protein
LLLIRIASKTGDIVWGNDNREAGIAGIGLVVCGCTIRSPLLTRHPPTVQVVPIQLIGQFTFAGHQLEDGAPWSRLAHRHSGISNRLSRCSLLPRDDVRNLARRWREEVKLA